jgi:hypothetical protein
MRQVGQAVHLGERKNTHKIFAENFRRIKLVYYLLGVI